MAATSGRTDTPLSQTLWDEPYRFRFFQAVRLLERLFPRKAPVGYHAVPEDEVVRFRSRLSLNFPPSEIHELRRQSPEQEDHPPEMTVAFMGMTGPLGVLPVPYTELVMERVRYKDRALWEFLDLFHHRLVSLFYRAWEKYRFPIAYERSRSDKFTGYLFSLIGMSTEGLRNRQQFPDIALLHYSGLIAQRPRSVAALQGILSDYFQAWVQIQQFQGQWLEIDEESLTFLGRANFELGVNAIAGSRLWDQQSKFRVCLGPLRLAQFLAFLPSGPSYRPIHELVRFLVGMEYDFDLQLILKAEEVPACQLTSQPGRQAMLGWTTWLKTMPFLQDSRQVVLSANW
jgi:type VI secretion system protein ImpH